MDRRTFLGSLIASAATKFLVLTEGDDGVKVQTNQNIPETTPVEFHFGDLKLLSCDATQLRVSNPFHKCPHTGRFQFAHMTTVDAATLVGPKAVVDQIYETYGGVNRAKERPLVVVKMMGNVVCTLEFALLQQVGWTATANGMSVVDNLSLVGRWKELHDAIDKFQETQRKEVELLEKVTGKKYVVEPEPEPEETHWCEDCNDFHE